MSQKIQKVVIETLGKDIKIERSFNGRFDGENGTLCITNENILFVNEKGFFGKQYKIIFNKTLDTISGLNPVENYTLEIVTNGDKHNFTAYDVAAKNIIEHINDVRKKEEAKA